MTFTSFLKKFSFSFFILILLFLSCLVVLFIVADMIFEDKSLSFDEHVFSIIGNYVSPALTKFMLLITFFGSQQFLLPANIFLMLYFFFVKRKKNDAVKILAVSLTSVIVLFSLKLILQRERPLVPLLAKVHGYSFPSGHTFSSVTFYGMIAYILWKNIQPPALRWIAILLLAILSILIGCSRVYLRLHYASDVIAGFCLGLIWLVAAKWILLRTVKTEINVPAK